jgi:hypothetical protein
MAQDNSTQEKYHELFFRAAEKYELTPEQLGNILLEFEALKMVTAETSELTLQRYITAWKETRKRKRYIGIGIMHYRREV